MPVVAFTGTLVDGEVNVGMETGVVVAVALLAVDAADVVDKEFVTA